MARLWIAALLGMLSFTVLSQTSKDSTKPAPEKKWFETFSVRGYVQARYNRLLETNPNLGNEQGDRSWGKNGVSFFVVPV